MFISIFQVVNEIFIIKEIDNKNNTAKVSGLVLSDLKRFRLPVKALRRSIPWLPVGAVVQVINKSHSNGMDKAQDWVWNSFLMLYNFYLHYISLKTNE
jgi:hypothetical protein